MEIIFLNIYRHQPFHKLATGIYFEAKQQHEQFLTTNIDTINIFIYDYVVTTEGPVTSSDAIKQRKIIMYETEKQQLLRENRELKKKLNLEIEDIPSYSFSQITLLELRSIVEIKLSLNDAKFNDWFNHSNMTLDNTDILFLENLITKHAFSIETYKEETLKIKFISPILNRIDFSDFEKEICDFYDEPLTYQTKKFILTGKVDFMVSKGYFYSETPYFFIQEFKPSTTAKNPQPQLLAELIAAVELNQFTTIKGAFIIGAIWHFVILEKIGIDSYLYFISKSYDSTDLEKLQGIYKNLLYVKQEIFALQDN